MAYNAVMILQSLGYRTDLFFPRFDGEVMDRGDYIVIRTPSNPSFYWGNFLLFTAPPAEGDFDRWRALFAKEIGASPTVNHMAFGWDGTAGETGEIVPFLEAGFTLEDSVVLTARAIVRPAKFNEEVVIRPLTEDWEWDVALENKIACRPPEHEEAGWRVYAAKQMARRRAMTCAGWGSWFGAFLDGRLIGNLGVFAHDRVGRFQSVCTHPDFRRLGVCGALVYEAAGYALANMGAEVLVMVADAHYHAARIYEGVGFLPVERQMGLTWWR
jgi:ribosomal protein S18 acetylase RimI-like enzyme